MPSASSRPQSRATFRRSSFRTQAHRINDRGHSSDGPRETELLHAGLAVLCRTAVGLVVAEVRPLATAQDTTSSSVVLAPYE